MELSSFPSSKQVKSLIISDITDIFENTEFNAFKGKNILAIGGGVGMAPINAIATDLIKKDNNVDVVAAAVTKDELLFIEDLENLGATIHPCTDDGSFGFKGFATDSPTAFNPAK